MKPQYDNLILSSFLLYLNNRFIDEGQAYANTSSIFYPTNTTFNGYYTYASPFNQFVADSSITNATVFTGVYLNNNYLIKGQSGFIDIDYQRGRLYFNQPVVGTLSGNYSVKDFNISLINMPEERLLFETKYSLRPKVYQKATGIASDALSYPALLIKSVGGTNEPLAFGGLDNTINNIGLFVFADSQYILDSSISILRDLAREYVPIFETGDMPFNVFGGFKTGVFNYKNVTLNRVANGSGIYIEKVDISRFERGDSNNLNPECYFAVVDFKLSNPRYPRI